MNAQTLHNLTASTDRQLHQVVHESLQTDIICEDCLCSLADTTIGTSGVGGGGVELRQKETCLRSTSIADDETWQGESVLDELLS